MRAFTFLFAYTIAAFGFCWIIGGSKITEGFRAVIWKLGGGQFQPKNMPDNGETIAIPPRGFLGLMLALTECPGCLGFHIGWITALLGAPSDLPGPLLVLAMFALACYTAGSGYLLGRLTGLIERP
jgi:hypothetical protein